MIEEVKTFVERKLFDAKRHNDPEYARDMFHSAFSAVCFVAETEHSDELINWWVKEMRNKFYELMY